MIKEVAMELGRIPEIDNAQKNHVEKVQQVQEVDNDNKVIDEEQYKKAASKGEEEDLNEVILDNVRFGYNKQSQDFYVKVTRGDAEYKFPTEEMMKMKAFLLESIENENK